MTTKPFFDSFSDMGPPTVFFFVCIFDVSKRCEKTCFPIDQQSAQKRPKVAQVQTRGRHDAKNVRIFGSWVPWPAQARVKDKLVQGTRTRGKDGQFERPVSQKESLRELTRLWARGPTNCLKRIRDPYSKEERQTMGKEPNRTCENQKGRKKGDQNDMRNNSSFPSSSPKASRVLITIVIYILYVVHTILHNQNYNGGNEHLKGN